jgi:type II secretory pathway component PulM
MDHSNLVYWFFIQDQTVKIAETRDLEDELQRVKAENAELQGRVSEIANIDAARKKAENRAEQLEERACLINHVSTRADVRARWT